MDIEDNIGKAMEKCVADLMEMCDSVQIIAVVSGTKKEMVISLEAGGGDRYSRQAAVREWLIFQDQYAKTFADWDQRRKLDDKSDPGENERYGGPEE